MLDDLEQTSETGREADFDGLTSAAAIASSGTLDSSDDIWQDHRHRIFDADWWLTLTGLLSFFMLMLNAVALGIFSIRTVFHFWGQCPLCLDCQPSQSLALLLQPVLSWFVLGLISPCACGFGIGDAARVSLPSLAMQIIIPIPGIVVSVFLLRVFTPTDMRLRFVGYAALFIFDCAFWFFLMSVLLPCCRDARGIRVLDIYGCPCGQGRRSRWRKLNRRARIAWVRVEAVRAWARAGRRIPRRQALRHGEYVVGAGLTFARMRRARCFVVSHAWLSLEHPDPHGTQLLELVAELNRLGAADADLIFYDFCSLPQIDKTQHPWIPRTAEEDRQFGAALEGMHMLYTFPYTKVLVLPNVPPTASNQCPYASRGWCFFEICISHAYRTICNVDANNVKDALRRISAEVLPCHLSQEARPLDTFQFREAFETKRFTCRGDGDLVKRLYDILLSIEPAAQHNPYREFNIRHETLVGIPCLWFLFPVNFAIMTRYLFRGTDSEAARCHVLQRLLIACSIVGAVLVLASS